MANLIIRDYEGSPYETDFDIDDLANVSCAWMTVVSGDEILTVLYKDGERRKWDSCPGVRFIGYEDGEYNIYVPEYGVDLLHDDTWLSMSKAYDRMYYPLHR